MKLSTALAFALACALTVLPLLIPENIRSLSLPAPIEQRDVRYTELERRKGGGGGGKGGGGGGKGGGGESSSGSSSSGNRGGASGSSSGTGPRPAYGSGGRYYGGGATTPYTSGLRSPSGLTSTALLSIAALTLFEGIWLNPAYLYPFPEPYTFYNTSAGQNQTKPVRCLCEQYQECGCDDNKDPTYMSSLLGNGSISVLNSTLIQVNLVNGTSTILINGTLPNGTTAASAAIKMGDGGVGCFGWALIASTITCFLVVL